jgi:hypothetical protein
MLKLLTCPQGHFWETADDAVGQEVCPECGAPADTLPLLDLAPTEAPPAPGPPPTATPPPLRDQAGNPVVAGYQVLEHLGTGPTGVAVYRARQVAVNRSVLLKVVWARDDPGQLAWGSLRGEASALGRLAHPNIVEIYEAGERERQLFYNAVELVDGPTLAEKVGDRPLPVRQVLPLLETLARAVHHAHEHNVVHRSLKPECILLRKVPRAECPEEDVTPPCCLVQSSVYLPKITDFGLARRPVEGDVTDLELQGEVPGYLAPEQAWGRVKDIGPATDVYALGGILYYLLTGRPPFRGATAAETVDAIQVKDLVPPSRVRRRVPADLDAICRKCLAKQPRRRYGSALELAEDLRRCAVGLPVRARRASNAQRFTRWVRRRPAAAALLLVTLLGLMASGIAFSIGADRAARLEAVYAMLRRDRDLAQNRATAAEVQLLNLQWQQERADYRQRIARAKQAITARDILGARNLLDGCPAADRRWEWFYLRQRLDQGGPTTLGSFSRPVTRVAFSPDGAYLAAAGGGPPNPAGGGPPVLGDVRVWRLATPPTEVFRVADFPGPVQALAFSPDGGFLATGGGDADGRSGEVRVWQIGGQVHQFTVHFPVPITDLAYSPDELHLFAAQADGALVKLLAANGTSVLQFGRGIASYPKATTRLALGAGGFHLVQATRGANAVNLWNPANGVSEGLVPGLAQAVALAGEEHLAVGREDGTIGLFAVTSGLLPPQEVRTWRAHDGGVSHLAFTREGFRLASAGGDRTVKVWDVDVPEAVVTLESTPAASLCFSPYGTGLAAGVDKEVVIWGNP